MSFAAWYRIITIRLSARRESFLFLVKIPPLERVKVKKDSPFSFTATVEIKPTIELRDYKAPNPISLKQDQRTVTDEQVQKALEVLREQMAQLHPAPTGTTLAEGDFAVVDIEGTLDGSALDGTSKTGTFSQNGFSCLRPGN